MKKAHIHFNTTYRLYSELRANAKENIDISLGGSIINHNNLKLNTELLKSLSEVHQEMMMEVFAIENEKLQLRNTKEEIPAIFEQERVNYEKTNQILTTDLKEAGLLKFKLNPCLKIYESNWKWIHTELEKNFFPLKYSSNLEKGDYYFLHQRTGTYDSIDDSNVLAVPLSLFQYCFLQQFEKPNTYISVMSEFKKLFEYSSLKEENNLETSVSKIFREFIFKLYIVPKDCF